MGIGGAAGNGDVSDRGAAFGGEDFTPSVAAVDEGEAVSDDLFEGEVFVEVEGAVHGREFGEGVVREEGCWGRDAPATAWGRDAPAT